MTMQEGIAKIMLTSNPELCKFLLALRKRENRKNKGMFYTISSVEEQVIWDAHTEGYVKIKRAPGQRPQVKMTVKGRKVSEHLQRAQDPTNTRSETMINIDEYVGNEEMTRLLLDACEAEGRIGTNYYTVRTVSRDTIMTAYKKDLIDLDPRDKEVPMPRLHLTDTGFELAQKLQKVLRKKEKSK
jgi:hypothetical protein